RYLGKDRKPFLFAKRSCIISFSPGTAPLATDWSPIMSRPPFPAGAKNPMEGTPYPFLLPPVEPNEIGRLGNYRIIRLLGRGGMGYVFHAEDLILRRPVALKVMKPDLEGEMKGWKRFLQEAQLMAAIKHDSLVTVFQADQAGDTLFLAMELLDGD